MAHYRVGPPCPECGASCITVDSRTLASGLVKRRYICDNLHRFTITDDTPLLPRGRPPKEPRPPKTVNLPILTEWRGNGNPYASALDAALRACL